MRKETRFDLELHGLNISLHLEPVFLSMHPAIFSGNFRTEKGNHYLVSGILSLLCLYLGFQRDAIYSLLAIAKDTKPVAVIRERNNPILAGN
jgi:hypothetical protein